MRCLISSMLIVKELRRFYQLIKKNQESLKHLLRGIARGIAMYWVAVRGGEYITAEVVAELRSSTKSELFLLNWGGFKAR